MQQDTTDIGARLQSAREGRGLTLRDVADSTKIAITALKSIERNDFAKLPGGLYRRAYLQAFATAVGLDAVEVTRAYRERFEPAPVAPAPPAPAVWGLAGRFRAHGRVVVATVALAAVLTAVLVLLRPDARPLEAGQAARPASIIESDAPKPVPLVDQLDENDDAGAITTAALDTSRPPLALRPRPVSAGDPPAAGLRP